MKFLIDAQLPAQLAEFLTAAGHDALHTRELSDGNRSTDSQIAERADSEERVVVTKDRDFRERHLLRGTPRRLLVVATGNVTNEALRSLFALHLRAIVAAFDETNFVQLSADSLLLGGARIADGVSGCR